MTFDLSCSFSSLLFYMMVAESGYAPAQFNAAYLCEQNTVSYLNTSGLSLFSKLTVMVNTLLK